MDDIRTQEKRVFLNAFYMYIFEFVKENSSKTVTLKKDKDNSTVVFEFPKENGIKTFRSFDEDLLFAYSIAVEAIKEEKENKPEWNFIIMDDKAVLTIN